MPEPTKPLRGDITNKELDNAAAAAPTPGPGHRKPFGTPPPTGLASPAVEGMDWP